MTTLLKYALSQIERRTTVELHMRVIEQKVHATDRYKQYEFMSSHGVYVSSAIGVDLEPAHIWLVGDAGFAEYVTETVYRFTSSEQCERYVSYMQQALEEWRLWGGFTNDTDGDNYGGTEAVRKPAEYGLITLYAEPNPDTILEQQLATF